MSKSSLVYFMLWLLLQSLVGVNCQLPFKRSGHTATLIDNKLYILGGINSGALPGKDFSYIDFSVPFNTQELQVQDLSDMNVVPSHIAASSARGGANNKTLFLYGADIEKVVYTFDPLTDSWTVPKIAGDAITKFGLTAAIDDVGKMYLWSGLIFEEYQDDMLILDTINLSWGKGTLENAPISRDLYAATILRDQTIIYMGGTSDISVRVNTSDLNIVEGDALPLTTVYLYDTINDKWSSKDTTGKIPANRAAFSTVLGLDGQRLILYGGFFNPVSGHKDSSIYVLDLNNYNWYIPKISGKIPAHRAWHKANIIGKYMVVTFGAGYDVDTESDVILLDISNDEEYVWTTTYSPSTPPVPSASPSPSPSSSQQPNNATNESEGKEPEYNKSVMIGAIIGSLVGGVLLSFGGFYLYKLNKDKQKEKHGIPIPEDDDDYYNNSQEEMLMYSNT